MFVWNMLVFIWLLCKRNKKRCRHIYIQSITYIFIDIRSHCTHHHFQLKQYQSKYKTENQTFKFQVGTIQFHVRLSECATGWLIKVYFLQNERKIMKMKSKMLNKNSTSWVISDRLAFTILFERNEVIYGCPLRLMLWLFHLK